MTVDLVAAERALEELLDSFGRDRSSGGLRGTARRAAKAWGELLGGYALDPSEVLHTSDGTKGFDEKYDQMVVLSGVPFWSMCEHHLMPFGGRADVGYIPGEHGQIVGLSKLARLVDVFARRLQVQERMTQEIAAALNEHIAPRGVGVRVRAEHTCMQCRGIKKLGTMSTEVLLGMFRNHEVRSEFWHLVEVGQ